MNFWRKSAVAFVFSGVFLTALFVGCTRQIAVNPTSAFLFTSTPTPPVITNTPTNTFTQTATLTPTQPLITYTPTSTPTITLTPTFAPPTNTYTATSTFTASPTVTVTSTPTPNYGLIDDFLGPTSSYSDSVSNIALVQDQQGNWRDGFWSDYSDGTPSFAAAPSGPGTFTTALECSGSMQFDAGFEFTFTNPGGGCSHNCGVSYYDATVNNTYTGISFWAKANSVPVTNCGGTQALNIDLVDNEAVTDHLTAVALTATWQQFTIYYNQALNSSGVTVNAKDLLSMVFEPISNGAAGYAYDFSIGDITLATGGPGSPATAIPSKLLTNLENGTNQIMYPAAITQGQTPGYWYTTCDTYGTTMCPSGTAGTIFFPVSPGDSSNFAAHMSGQMYDNTTTNYPYAEMGFNFINGTPPQAINLATYSGCSATSSISFDMKSSQSNAVWFSISDAGTTLSSDTAGINLTAATGWTPVTVTFASMQTQSWGTPYPYSFSAGNGGTPPYEQAVAPTWEVTTSNAVIDLWVDNIQLNP